MDEAEKTRLIDDERLRWIAFFHYISGGLTIAFSSMFIFHVIFFGFMLSNPEIFNPDNLEMPEMPLDMLQVFVGLFGTLIVLGIVYGICEILSGVFIKRRRHRLFSFIVAIPRLLLLPYGTILSVFTLMLLERESVKQQYEDANNG
jgi:hypothetical protein